MFGKMNYEKIFEDIFEKLKNVPDEGKVADYIPELARVNPDSFGVHLTTVDGVHYAFGAVICTCLFPSEKQYLETDGSGTCGNAF